MQTFDLLQQYTTRVSGAMFRVGFEALHLRSHISEAPVSHLRVFCARSSAACGARKIET